MDWFLYDGDLRHERVRAFPDSFLAGLLQQQQQLRRGRKAVQEVCNFLKNFKFVTRLFSYISVSLA